MNYFIRATLLLCATLIISAQPARADEQTKTEEGYLYAPADCEFQVKLPSTPVHARRCSKDNPDECHAVTSFTKVFGLDATIDIRLTCNKAEKGMYDRYTGAVMKATLEGMAGKNKLDEYETHFRQSDDAKEAVLIGAGEQGNSNKIYMAQLWIGHDSIFTIEGELIGGPLKEADDMFAEILRSAMLKKDAAAKDKTSEKEDKEEKK